jgi:hypothetical protein
MVRISDLGACCAPIGPNAIYLANFWYLQEPKGEEESQRTQEK